MGLKAASAAGIYGDDGGDGGSILGSNFDTVQIHQKEVGACSETGSK